MKIYAYSFIAPIDDTNETLYGCGLIGFSSLTTPLETHKGVWEHIVNQGYMEFSITSLSYLGEQLLPPELQYAQPPEPSNAD